MKRGNYFSGTTVQHRNAARHGCAAIVAGSFGARAGAHAGAAACSPRRNAGMHFSLLLRRRRLGRLRLRRGRLLRHFERVCERTGVTEEAASTGRSRTLPRACSGRAWPASASAVRPGIESVPTSPRKATARPCTRPQRQRPTAELQTAAYSGAGKSITISKRQMSETH